MIFERNVNVAALFSFAYFPRQQFDKITYRSSYLVSERVTIFFVVNKFRQFFLVMLQCF